MTNRVNGGIIRSILGKDRTALLAVRVKIMLTFILGGCGTGKSTRLMERIRRDIAGGKEVAVLVPEQFSFEEEKKLYDFLGAEDFNKLQTFSFMTLSRNILQLYGRNARAERYASDQEKLVFLYEAVRTTVGRGELKSLSRRSESPEFVESLLALFVKLRKAGVTCEKLEAAAQGLPELLREKTEDIAAILLEYERILHEHQLYDSLTDLAEASFIANVQDYFAGKELYIDEFDSFTGDQYGMLEVMLAQGNNVTAAIRTDEPEARISPIFEGGNRTYRALRDMAKTKLRILVATELCTEYRRSEHSDLRAISTQILRPLQKPAEYEGHVHIMAAEDTIDEAEYICATICRMLAEDSSLRCRDIAIAVKSMESYGFVLQRALERYDLPYHISSANPILHTELIRYFLSLLTLLAAEDWDTDKLLHYLKNPFSGYQPIAVSMLEHYCFTWGIEKNDWLVPFYEEGTEAAERAASFGGAYLEKTRERIVTEIRTLADQCKGKNVEEICGVLYKQLCSRKKAREEYLESLDTLQKREFTTLWNMLMDIMDTIVSCCGDQLMTIPELYEMFRLMISSSHFSTPPQTLDSIQIVEAQTARLNAPSVVFVPGVNEDVFPGEIALHGMFSRQELELLEAQDIVISRMFFELYSDERLIVHKLFSAPSQHLCLSYPAISGEGKAVKPSMVISQVTSIFREETSLITRQADISLIYYVRTYAAAYFHYVRALRKDCAELPTLEHILLQHPDYAPKVRKLVDTSAVIRHEVSAESMKAYLGDTLKVSPSAIESFFECPFKYFCSSCLHLYVPEKIEFSHRNVGNFAHYCLEQILRKYDVGRFTELTAVQLLDEIRECSDVFSRSTLPDALRRSGRFRLNYNMAGKGLLKLLQHMQKEMRGGQFTPVGFEVEMDSSKPEAPLPSLSLRDGKILCRGKIDRVDCCSGEGSDFLRVVDYKTGERLFAPEKLERGLDMQMLIYLFALKQCGAYGDSVPSGVLYMPSGQVSMKNYQERSADADASEVMNKFYQMKGLILDSASPLMEPEITAGCAPVLNKSKTSLYTVSSRQMEKLEQHVKDKICEMADSLYAGKVAPDPYCYDKSPCTFCGCSDICGVEPELKEMTEAERRCAVEAVFSEVNESSEEEEDA